MRGSHRLASGVFAALLALWGGLAAAQPLVVVDAGHGGRDPGAVGCNLQEKDVVLDVSRRLDGLLRGAGLRSALTRGDDSFVELRARAAFANDRGATLFVAIHANANAGSPATGTETWIAEGASNTSNQLATRLQRELIAEWGLRDRGVKRANFTVLTATAMPAALTELAFINRCDPDAALLGNANARAGIAAAHARAITAQLGVEAPPPPDQTGVLRGVVFEDRGAGLDDPSMRLGGATVTASGQQARSAADTGAWQFTLPPGEHRVVARLDGFADGTRTCTVVAGQDVWCSVGLVRAMQPPPPPPDPEPDALVPDPVVADAAVEDASVRPPQEAFDLGAPDFGRPPEGEVDAYRPPARPRDGGRPPAEDTDGGAPAEDEPTGAFCAAAPGASPTPGLAWLLVLLLAPVRRRLAWLLALAPLSAQAHVPTDLPAEGTEAVAEAAHWPLEDVAQLAEGPYIDAILSPDGQRVLLVHRDGKTLSVMDARPGAPPAVLATVGTRGAAWYPDGRGVSVHTPDQPLTAIPVIGLDLAGQLEVPRVAPRTTRVGLEGERAFVEEAGTRYPISVPGERAFRAVASPDGEHVVIWGLAHGLHLLRLADGLVVPLGGGHPRFDPSGRYLVFERTRDEGVQLTGGDVFVVALGAARPRARALTATADRVELAPSIAAGRVTFVTATGAVFWGRLPTEAP